MNKYKLINHYNKIKVTAVSGKSDIVSFKDSAHNHLHHQWEHDKQDLTSDKYRVIDMVEAYILDDIRTSVFDNSSYSSFIDTDEINSMVPPFLLRFLQDIIKSKAENQEVINRRIFAIVHSLISAARPRSLV